MRKESTRLTNKAEYQTFMATTLADCSWPDIARYDIGLRADCFRAARTAGSNTGAGIQHIESAHPGWLRQRAYK